MEKRIKTLYILSIIAILTFLGMQGYWLYIRYEYSLREYEMETQDVIESLLVEYDKLRLKFNPEPESITRRMTENNLNTDMDSLGNNSRRATVTTRVFNASKLLGITEIRKLTEEEMERLSKLVEDSLAAIDSRTATFDATSAPTDGAAWTAMNKFELDMRSPFATEGIDSLLRRERIDAEISLVVTDSMMWKPVLMPHTSVINPHFTMIHPYSELERKAVVIDCRIPSSDVLEKMGWTLALAFALSAFLIACLVWQIKTIVRLTRLDKMRSMFVTTMIHELKRPISTLKMCVSGIESDKLMEDVLFRKEVSAEMRGGLDSLSSYFSRLRDITFNNVDQIPLNVESFNLHELVDSVITSIPVTAVKRVNFVNDVPKGMEISADRSHLSNMLTNLIENAVKYSGDEVSVRISGESVDGGVRIDVADNGNGISSADKGRIFNRFYRGKAFSTDIPGMGLGLTYVKLLVDAHCGDISVESREGEGSIFTIKLPQ